MHIENKGQPTILLQENRKKIAQHNLKFVRLSDLQRLSSVILNNDKDPCGDRKVSIAYPNYPELKRWRRVAIQIMDK